MKWAPRLCSLLLTFVWLLQGWLAVVDNEDPLTRMGRTLLALALLACAALLLAWRRPWIGGGIASAAAVTFGIVNWFAARGSAPLVMIGLLIAGAFVLTSLLFIVTARFHHAPGRPRWPGVTFAVLVTLFVLAMTAISLGMGVGHVMVG